MLVLCIIAPSVDGSEWSYWVQGTSVQMHVDKEWLGLMERVDVWQRDPHIPIQP